MGMIENIKKLTSKVTANNRMASSTLAPTPPTTAFVVTKHSWKGKYRRVLSLSKEFISTLNPSTMEATNSWKLSDIVSAQPLNAAGKNFGKTRNHLIFRII